MDAGRLHGNLGLKAIYTRIKVRQNQTGDTRAYGDTNLDVGDTFSSNSYWDWLPSVNLQYDVTDNLKLRASFAKTMIPLDLGNYGGGLQIFTADSQGPTPENPNAAPLGVRQVRSEEHTSELQSLMRMSYAVFCLKNKKTTTETELET